MSPAIAADPRFELAATSSRSGKGPQPAFTDWREMIRSVEGLQAVAITTPPGPRYEIARECLLAGLHCLLEKPPAAGLAEIADLDCLAEAQGARACSRPGMPSIIARWPPPLARSPVSASHRWAITWHEDVHKWHPGQAWIWQPGGFGVFDPGINAFSIATKIFPGGLFVRGERR